MLWQVKPAVYLMACLNASTFGSLSRSFLSLLQHNYLHIGLLSLAVPSPLVLWGSQTSLPSADWEAISLVAPAPSLLWLLSPQSLQALSQLCPWPADPSYLSSVSWEEGKGWKRVVLHWGTLSNYHRPRVQPQWKWKVRTAEIAKNGTGETGWRPGARKGEEWYEEDQTKHISRDCDQIRPRCERSDTAGKVCPFSAEQRWKMCRL